MNDKVAGKGLAAGAIASALLELLHTKGILTLDQSRDVLLKAMDVLAPHMSTPAGIEANQIIGGLLRGPFSARESTSADSRSAKEVV
jgi:hypothetical protein